MRRITTIGAFIVVLLISGSLEYKSDESLAEFQKYIETQKES